MKWPCGTDIVRNKRYSIALTVRRHHMVLRFAQQRDPDCGKAQLRALTLVLTRVATVFTARFVHLQDSFRRQVSISSTRTVRASSGGCWQPSRSSKCTSSFPFSSARPSCAQVPVTAMLLVRNHAPAIHDAFEGEIHSSGALSRPRLKVHARFGAVTHTRKKPLFTTGSCLALHKPSSDGRSSFCSLWTSCARGQAASVICTALRLTFNCALLRTKLLHGNTMQEKTRTASRAASAFIVRRFAPHCTYTLMRDNKQLHKLDTPCAVFPVPHEGRPQGGYAMCVTSDFVWAFTPASQAEYATCVASDPMRAIAAHQKAEIQAIPHCASFRAPMIHENVVFNALRTARMRGLRW